MPHLREFESLEAKRIIWETLREFALSSDPADVRQHFNVESESGLIAKAFAKYREVDIVPSHILGDRYPPFRHAVLKVYQTAINMGLLLPYTTDQSLDWGLSQGAFHFTEEGISYFSNGLISVDDPGYLAEALRDLQDRIQTVSDSQIQLLLEAQQCLRARCFRAGMVVLGLANETMCMDLLEAIPVNCSPPTPDSDVYSDWQNCNNASLSFSARWKRTVRLLEALKRNLRTQGRGTEWWQWWEMIPGSLHTLGEAVRIARNSAAHSSERSFNRAELALILAGMPIHLEMIASITNFLQNPPAGVTLQF